MSITLLPQFIFPATTQLRVRGLLLATISPLACHWFPSQKREWITHFSSSSPWLSKGLIFERFSWNPYSSSSFLFVWLATGKNPSPSLQWSFLRPLGSCFIYINTHFEMGSCFSNFVGFWGLFLGLFVDFGSALESDLEEGFGLTFGSKASDLFSYS